MPTFSQKGFVPTVEHEGEFETPESDIQAGGGVIFDITGTIRPEIFALAEKIDRGLENQTFEEIIDQLFGKTKP